MDRTQLPCYGNTSFSELAKKDGDFQTIWLKWKGRIDFQDAETIKVLTKALLRTDFGLELDVPDDRLCPPVPNRWSYVSWIQNLIDSTSPNYASHYDPDRKVVGLDIGTGASAIYTMLCLKTRPNWTMCATDIDKKSFSSAIRNLAINNLVTRTKPLLTSDTNDLIPLQHFGVDKIDFTICNPPFFADEKSMYASFAGKGKKSKPNAVCTGAAVEMVCTGGDLAFVTRILNESLVLKERVTWYSSMLGKLSSAKAIIDLLKQQGISNWAVGIIDTGSLTKRWVVAWSFGDLRPKNSIVRVEAIPHEYLPFPTEYRIPLSPHQVLVAGKTVHARLSSLDLHLLWDPETVSGIGEASQNVWSRAYRRGQQRRKECAAAGNRTTGTKNEAQEARIALAFRVLVDTVKQEVLLQWLRGADQQLWESFCGMMHRDFKK